MIFGLMVPLYVIGIVTLTLTWIFILYLGFLTGFKEEVQMQKYFAAMFDGYRASKLLKGWKLIILMLEYLGGMYGLIIVKSAWYLSELTKKTAKWIFIEREAPKVIDIAEELAEAKSKGK